MFGGPPELVLLALWSLVPMWLYYHLVLRHGRGNYGWLALMLPFGWIAFGFALALRPKPRP